MGNRSYREWLERASLSCEEDHVGAGLHRKAIQLLAKSEQHCTKYLLERKTPQGVPLLFQHPYLCHFNALVI